MNDTEKLEQAFARPLSGAEVAVLPPALIPERAILTGGHISLEPQNDECPRTQH